MIIRENDRRSAAAFSALIATLQAEPAASADPSEHYRYRVAWSGEEQAFRGTVDELPTLCWLAGDHIAALAGIRNRARESVAEATAGGGPVPQPFGALEQRPERLDAGAVVPVWMPVELYAAIEEAARQQQVEPRWLAISRLAGSREIAEAERWERAGTGAPKRGRPRKPR